MRATLLVLFAIAMPLPAADADYYPMKIGNKWTFKIGEQDDRFVWTAAKNEKVGTQDCVLMEARVKGEMVGSEHIAVLKDGIFRFKMGEAVIEPPICFFKSNARGEKWKETFKIGDMASSADYSATVEDVDVPAGKFKDAVVVNTQNTYKDAKSNKDVTFKASISYAKDIGIIKQAFEETNEKGTFKFTLVLEKFEPAKDEPKK